MELVGMEGILGAFLVGIVLNRLIPPSSPLMSHIEFVGNALFIPYFLIGVGMLINLGALVNHDGAILAACVMVIVALISKWSATWVTQKVFRMSSNERRLMFGLTGSRAAATLAVVLVGYKIILPDGSMITEGTSRKMATLSQKNLPTIENGKSEEDHAMLPPQDAPDRILIALRYPEMVSQLVDLALMLRTPHSVAPPIALNIVLENEPSARQNGEEQLDRAVKHAAATNIRIQKYQRWSVNVASGISHTIKERDVSDLVLGLHQKARISDSFYGKLSTDLLTSVDRQIFILRANIPLNTVQHLHILVPPKSEFEQGFTQWMDRIALIARQLSCGITAYSTGDTLTAMDKYYTQTEKGIPLLCEEYHSWNDLVPLAHQSRQDHLTVFVCARRGTVSYHNYIDRLPDQMERYFSSSNILLVFPKKNKC